MGAISKQTGVSYSSFEYSESFEAEMLWILFKGKRRVLPIITEMDAFCITAFII